MKIRKVLFVFTAAAALVGLISTAGGPARRGSSASPFLKVGPQAIQSNAAGPNYGLFTCQVGAAGGVVCYDPYQIRHAYHIDNLIKAGFDGRGKTIVIIDAFQSPNMVGELNTFDTFYGLPTLNGLGGAPNPALGTFTQIAPDGLTPFDPTSENMIGWAAEITLDVTWAHAIAPGANIVLVLAKSNDDADIFSATKYAIDHRLGDVVSQSFGENESCVDPALLAKQHTLFAEATLKGMTLFASSGDDGSAQPTCDGTSLVQAVSSPAVDPLVTAVGGTELHAADYCLPSRGCDPTANPAAGTYQSEIAWNEGAAGYGGTGGGFSVLFDQPFYQRGAFRSKHLGVPDVSYNAAVLHGVLTYIDIPGYGTGWSLFGGTSAGSPQWAALLAIADQKNRFDLGFINAALYRVAQKHYSASYFDVTSGDNAVYVPGFAAGPGWDATTGLGSPTADQLISDLIRYQSPADGILEIAESLLHSLNLPQRGGHMGPH